MITGLLILVGILVGLMVVVGWIFITFEMLTDYDWTGKAAGAFMALLGIGVILFVAGVASGEIKLESVEDGCYQVINDTDFMPTGKTFIVYNDRHYISIPCPGD